MANDLFVQLFAPTRGNRGHIGTAYPVAKNVLLTAAHVIKDLDNDALRSSSIDRVEARWWKRKDDAPRFCQEILWDGTECGHDVMLLKCDFPVPFRDRWRSIEYCEPRAHQKFETQGFARAEKRAEALTRRLLAIQGKTCEMTVGAIDFDVIVTAGAPAEVEGWKGASGSPVFVDNRIVGVIGRAPGDYNAQRLRCAPLCLCLEHDDFKKHLFDGDRKAAADLNSLKKKATDILALSPEATQALAIALGPQAGLDSARKCIDELVEKTAGSLLGTCIRAQQGLPPRSPARKAIREVSLCLLPAAFHFWDDQMRRVREHMERVSAVMLSIPVDDDETNEAIFEVYMAGAGGREMRLRYDGRRWRPAEELLVEEAECGPKPREGFREHVHRKIIRGTGPPTELARLKIIQKLRNDLEFDRYRHYFIYRSSDYSAAEVKKLTAEFDGLIVMAEWAKQDSEDLAVEEFNVVDILTRILSS